MRITNRVLSIGRLMLRRFFPYPHYFVITLPFLALLISFGILPITISSLYYLVPCVITLMAMFAYNEISDIDIDPPKKNMISSGKLLKTDAIVFTVLSVLVALISAVAIYKSPLAILAFCSFVFFSMTYSGLRIRFKTTLAGPVVASYILWVAPALILLTEFSFWNPVSISLLCGIFLVFTAHELHHQIDDYLSDKEMNVKTLAVRIGTKKALYIGSISTSIGFLFILYGVYSSLHSLVFLLFMSLLYCFVILQIVLARKKSVLITGNVPTKFVLVTFSCISLGFSTLLTLLILMVFVAEIYGGFIQYWKIPQQARLTT